jgi:hypothetical protein
MYTPFHGNTQEHNCKLIFMGYYYKKTTNHKVGASTILTTNEEIYKLIQWILDMHELGYGFNIGYFELKVAKIT